MNPLLLASFLSTLGLGVLVSGKEEEDWRSGGSWDAFFKSRFAREASEKQRVAFDWLQEQGLPPPFPEEVVFYEPADILAFYGLKSESALDRWVYRHTESGLWLRLFGPGYEPDASRNRDEQWTILVQQAISGLVVLSMRQRGMVRLERLSMAPSHVLAFLDVNEVFSDRSTLLLPNLTIEQVEEAGMVDRVVRSGPIRAYIHFTVQNPGRREHEGGIVVGGIIEDSEAELPPEKLHFPFSRVAFEAFLDHMDAAANDLWVEIHGPDPWEDEEDLLDDEEVP